MDDQNVKPYEVRKSASGFSDSDDIEELISKGDFILDALAEGICLIDLTGQITFANNAAALMLRRSPGAMVGKNYQDILFGRDAENVTVDLSEPIAFALEVGDQLHINAENFIAKDGSQILVEYIVIPLRVGESVKGAIVSFEDIGERRDLELAAAKAREAALKDSEAKSAFLANVSHEIRTPLNGIIGTTDLLSATGLTDEQRRYFRMLKTSSHHLLEIVNDLLDLSKLEAHRIDLDPCNLVLHDLIEETEELFSGEASKKNLRFTTKIEKGVPRYIKADDSRLQQILNNLLSNAFKFTSEGFVELKVTSLPESRGMPRLKFEVVDTGIGISEDNIKLIFEPFTQAEIKTSRQFGGTGLGLAIAKQLVELMDGEIGVESNLTKGSKFWFTIGVELCLPEFLRDQTRARENAPAISPTASLAPVAPKRVLLVEDNEINRDIAFAMLRHLGIACDIAENGREAVEAFSNSNYDFILMDCAMPDMDGFEATRRIRVKEGPIPKTKIYALTASAPSEIANKCSEAGMDGVLTKPVTSNELRRVLLAGENDISSFNLDSNSNFVQHPLSRILEKRVLSNLIAIEANGFPNFVIETVRDFVSHVQRKIASIESSLEISDFTGVSNNAHSAKGSSANIGIPVLAHLFAEIEDLSFRKNRTGAARILKNVNDKVAELRQELANLVS